MIDDGFYREKLSQEPLSTQAQSNLDEMLSRVPNAQYRGPQYQLNMVELMAEARRYVQASTLFKRFIEHTPLENDIACWMADFAVKHRGQP